MSPKLQEAHKSHDIQTIKLNESFAVEPEMLRRADVEHLLKPPPVISIGKEMTSIERDSTSWRSRRNTDFDSETPEIASKLTAKFSNS